MVSYFEIFGVIVLSNYRSRDYCNYPLFRFYLSSGLFRKKYTPVKIKNYIIPNKLF